MTDSWLGIRPMSHSAIIREGFSSSRWELTQRATTGQCAERETLEYSILNGLFHQTLPIQGSGKYTEEEKDCESQWGWGTPRKQCLPDTTGLCTYELRDHNGSKPDRLYWEGKWTRASIPNAESISNWLLLAKKN